MEEKSTALTVINAALTVPGVKVDRSSFLLETLKPASDKVQLLLEKGPIASGLYSQERIRKVAYAIAKNRTKKTSGLSFIAGVPGGFAMLGTIPADTAQFYGYTLRLAQEIAYLYDTKDFWDDGNLNEERVSGELMLYLAVMMGVSGAASAVRIIASRASTEIARKLAGQSLTKTVWYPLMKKLASYLGVKLTKDTASRGIAKLVPLLGGFVSGGLTYYALSTMSDRLILAFDEGVEYTPEEQRADRETIRREMPDVYDVIFEERP